MDIPLPYQQPYQPVVAVPVRTRYALHTWRMGLRIAATAIAVLAFILDVAGGATYNPYYIDYNDEYVYSWPIAGSAMIPIAVIWNVSEFITVCVNRRGIHPGAHIALDFCIATGFFTAGTFDIIFFVTLEIAAGSLEILAGIIHLILFILACIAVHKWRRMRNPRIPQNAQFIYVQQQQPMMAAQPGFVPAGAPMLVHIPQAAPGAPQPALPPPPPGMAYLVPIPQHEQQQYRAVAPQQRSEIVQETTGFKVNDAPMEETPELNARPGR